MMPKTLTFNYISVRVSCIFNLNQTHLCLIWNTFDICVSFRGKYGPNVTMHLTSGPYYVNLWPC